MSEVDNNFPITALMCSLETSLEIMNLLPKTDLCELLNVILLDQIDILCRMSINDKFEEKEIIHHCNSCFEIISELQVIKESIY